MQHKGYIKLHRQIKNTSIWSDSNKLKLWIMCLIKAAHCKQNFVIGEQIVELEAGQFVTGRSMLEAEFNKDVTPKKRVNGLTLFRWLELFENAQMLNIKKTNKCSIITVLNWDKYQTNEQQMNNSCTTNEQQMNTYKNSKNSKNSNNVLNKYKEVVSIETVDNEIKKCECRTSSNKPCRRMAKISIDGKLYCGQHSTIKLIELGCGESKDKKISQDTYSSVINSYTENEELKIELKHYVDMRIKMKGFTVHALELKLKDLDKLAINESMKIEIVKQSIKKSWRGFFPLKNDSSGKKQSNDDLAF